MKDMLTFMVQARRGHGGILREWTDRMVGVAGKGDDYCMYLFR